MAQNECQQMEKAAFYQGLRTQISTVYNIFQAMQRASEFLATMDAATALAMEMDNTTRDVIADLRTAIDEILDFYDGTATTQTEVLKTQINLLRYL